MPSRSDLDMPATVIAAVIGVAIIAVALPFTISAFPQTPKSYDATWGERAIDTKTLTVPTETGTYRATVAGSDFQPASIKVEVQCSDSFNANLQQQAATLRVKLTRAGAAAALKEETLPCADGSFTVTLGSHADVAGAQANSAETAEKVVWLDAMAGNTTATYTLEVAPSRPPSGVPTLPVTPPTSLTATLRVTLNAWDVAMNEHQEVLR